MQSVARCCLLRDKYNPYCVMNYDQLHDVFGYSVMRNFETNCKSYGNRRIHVDGRKPGAVVLMVVVLRKLGSFPHMNGGS